MPVLQSIHGQESKNVVVNKACEAVCTRAKYVASCLIPNHICITEAQASSNNIFPGNLKYLYSLLYFISFTWPLGPFDSLCKKFAYKVTLIVFIPFTAHCLSLFTLLGKAVTTLVMVFAPRACRSRAPKPWQITRSTKCWVSSPVHHWKQFKGLSGLQLRNYM